MTGRISDVVRAAMPVARAALERASAHGPADAIVVALDAAGLLQSPETAAELVRLRQERAALNEVLAGGDQERGLLRDRVAELENRLDQRLGRLTAAACPTSGCGSSAAYLDTSTVRMSGWIEVRPHGGAAATARWFCGPLCAALGLGGAEVDTAVRNCPQCTPREACPDPGCGVEADDVDGSDPALWGWICVAVGGTEAPMRWVCSPWCAAAAIRDGGADLAAQDRALTGGEGA